MKFPLRTEIEVIPGDPAVGPYDIITISSNGRVTENRGRNLVLGWKITEVIGVMAINAKGIAKGSISGK